MGTRNGFTRRLTARAPGARPVGVRGVGRAAWLAAVMIALVSSGCASLFPERASVPRPAPTRALPPTPEPPEPGFGERTLEVSASAYTSHVEQTSAQPWIAAWGDRLHPDVKSIAVSRDLVEMGLTRGVRVRIDGLPGEYVVLDKMAKRWRRKIDIYMGEDVDAAIQWGVRKVRIRWRPPHAEAP